MIEKHGDRFGVEPICRVLGYPSASTYYARRDRPPSARAVRDELVLAEIGRVRTGFAAVYGARRTWVALRRAGVEVARCTVERLMRAHGLVGVQRGRKPRTTTPDAAAARPGDLVKRNFVAKAPNQLWLSDITYLPTRAGFVYVAFVQDCFSRMIVGWQTADHLRTELPLDALNMALHNRRTTGESTVHHSDAGSQYTSVRYGQRLADFGLAPSVGSVGDSYDNAMAEALNGTFKAEIFAVFGGFESRPAAEIATYEWVSWYNHARIHTELGDMPPAEYEARFHADHTATAQRFVTGPGNETPEGVGHGPM
jgi:putative transposase